MTYDPPRGRIVPEGRALVPEGRALARPDAETGRRLTAVPCAIVAGFETVRTT